MKKRDEERDERHVRLEIITPDATSHLDIPLAASGVSAGFPSPAEDFTEQRLDLNKTLIQHPAATFFARVDGDSMIGDGDLLVIDRAVEPFDGCIAVCFIDGEFTLKHVKLEKDHAWLVPANPKFKPIKVTGDNEFMIWGVVRYSIRKH